MALMVEGRRISGGQSVRDRRTAAVGCVGFTCYHAPRRCRPDQKGRYPMTERVSREADRKAAILRARDQARAVLSQYPDRKPVERLAVRGPGVGPGQIARAGKLLERWLELAEAGAAQGERAGPKQGRGKSMKRGGAKVGMGWERAQRKAEAIVRKAGGAMPSVAGLATAIGCSRATLRKAIERSSYLKARHAEAKQRAGRGRLAMGSAGLGGIEQQTETGPAESVSNAELLERLRLEQADDDRRDARRARARVKS